MPYPTDERLKSYLDTNQLSREQMCLAILTLDKRFADVRPRHPRGGPDGGRDIEAVFRGSHRAFGAVGFVNQADDSAQKKKQVIDKFGDDLAAALAATPKPEVFVFMTNVNFTIGEKEDLVARARGAGFVSCEIFDRERLRIGLDSTDGFAIRFQFLGIPLSEAEQASFFARWGDDIQSVISTGFQRVQSTLDRVLFLQEAMAPLSAFVVQFELDRVYSADEIGHFRAFCALYLKEPKHGIVSMLFGSADREDRMRDDYPEADKKRIRPGIGAGIGGGQWEERYDPSEPTESMDETELESDEELKPAYTQVGWISSIGMREVRFITTRYSKDALIRLEPVLALRDLDESTFIVRMNRGLADKVDCIHVYANEYKLLEIRKADFRLDDNVRKSRIPVEFSEEELRDQWVYVRPQKWTMFALQFAQQTPQRLYTPRETPNSLRTQIGS